MMCWRMSPPEGMGIIVLDPKASFSYVITIWSCPANAITVISNTEKNTAKRAAFFSSIPPYKY